MTDLPEWLDRFIDEWVEHQKKKPDAPDDYLANIDHLRIQADRWEAEDAAYRVLVGAQLAQRALDERMKYPLRDA